MSETTTESLLEGSDEGSRTSGDRHSADYHIFVDPEEIRRERRKAQELRASSWWRQQIGRGRCYYCEGRFPKEALTMDHVVPIARGGKSTKKNCVVCCKTCNTQKGHRMPVEITMQAMAEAKEDSSGHSEDVD